LPTKTLPKSLKDLPQETCEGLLQLSERELATKDPLSLVQDGHLIIKTKDGKLKPFTLNKAQQKILLIIRALIVKKKPVRLLILKARQLGCSTLIEAIIYAYTSQQENNNSLIVADDQDGSNYLFEISKLYQEKCPSHLKSTEKKSNEKKLEFDHIHSQILIDTANHKEAGRKYTFRYVHLSEYAFFPYPAELMLGVSNSVPTLPNTMIIKESTANGFNHFKQEWDDAVAKFTDYVPIFIPWYWGEDYRMASEGFVLGDIQLPIEVTKDEQSLYNQMTEEGIDFIEERLAWRRYKIKNDSGGKVANFQQENPSTPEEAFIASGDCAFDKEELVRQLKRSKPPIAVGNIVKVDYKFQFRILPDGDFKFWEKIKPRSEEEYIVSGDACSGSGTDWAMLTARAKRTNTIAVTFRAKCDPDVLAEKAFLLASFLHNAEVAIENDKYGFHANLKLRAIYGNLYMQESIDSEKKTVSQKFGWNTTSKSRPSMLGELKEEIRQGAIELNDPLIIRECLTFIKNAETKKEEAQVGCNDDAVISVAIGGAVRLQHPYTPIVSRRSFIPKPPPSNSGSPD